ncbi:MAG: hypothetical protein EPO07_03845 [Verrucomicrobia bacterium]|nr:MAG: hypothetical protein EPO07_03845 [Verrucomicrobiota bacterium]
MTAAQNRLLALTKELLAEWAETKQYWRDAKATEFEKRYLDELESAVNVAIANLEPLERVLKQIHDDCD